MVKVEDEIMAIKSNYLEAYIPLDINVIAAQKLD